MLSDLINNNKKTLDKWTRMKMSKKKKKTASVQRKTWKKTSEKLQALLQDHITGKIRKI